LAPKDLIVEPDFERWKKNKYFFGILLINLSSRFRVRVSLASENESHTESVFFYF